jgi:hypothetical protein
MGLSSDDGCAVRACEGEGELSDGTEVGIGFDVTAGARVSSRDGGSNGSADGRGDGSAEALVGTSDGEGDGSAGVIVGAATAGSLGMPVIPTDGVSLG